MRIVIDMQGVQSESRFRGIGRYTLSLAQAIVRNRSEHEVIIALSGLFPSTIEPIRAAFDGLLSQENIRVWYAPGPVRDLEPHNGWRRQVAERIREAFLASLQPDVVHVSSLFEGYVDDAVTSIGIFARDIPTVITLYDLIPLLNPDTYLANNPAYAHYYKRKIRDLKKASRWLAISESAGDEARVALGLNWADIVNISGACDSVFRPISMSMADRQQFFARLGLPASFILYTGGADARKNLNRLILAYAQLPESLRKSNSLVLAGKISEDEIVALRRYARSTGLQSDAVHITGYVSDEDLARLYNLCRLFVFPSLHEGFGLPVLEAMACGAPVIGANTTSIPEVIGRQDALFDPYDESAISLKMAQVLQDENFCKELAAHGLIQSKKFSWDESARRALEVFEHIAAEQKVATTLQQSRRPKLAFVSPLPPERTGIADYSAELLPALAEHYDIEVVVDQTDIADPWILANCPIRDVQWLEDNAHCVDRVLYHIGNSPFHQHMLPLLAKVPGSVVLHDFFLSGLLGYLEEGGIAPGQWVSSLYHAHGYWAVHQRFKSENVAEVKTHYPVNLEVLQRAQGVIVHSAYSKALASRWYGKDFSNDWACIPLLRKPIDTNCRDHARHMLGVGADDFLICSFGFLDPTKLNHRLLEAWLQSSLSQDKRSILVFVGDNHRGNYGDQLIDTIRAADLGDRIRITGWADEATFKAYLAAADAAVQLRTLSRGETSAGVMDCMNHALATIVNANGSMADLPAEAVWMLSDEFEDSQLIEALETLWRDNVRRLTLGRRAQEIIHSHHAPEVCAEQYAEAIERFHARSLYGSQSLVQAVAALDEHCPVDAECMAFAQAAAQTLPARQGQKQLLLDISVTCRTDLKTGIERVARGLVMALLESPPSGYRIEPVYLSNEGGQWHYRYARRYTLGLLQCPCDFLDDDPVEPRNGDLLMTLDLSGQMLLDAQQAGLFSFYRNAGIRIFSVVFDLLPVQFPQYFPVGTECSHTQWLQAITKFDGAVCISKAVANDLASWLERHTEQPHRQFSLGCFHLGADIESSAASRGLPHDAEQVLVQIAARPSFLMVGTIEPRKGFLQTIEAFIRLWQEDKDVNLVIVGKEGWRGLPNEMRRTIPEIIRRLQTSPELDRRLIWLEGISDEYLEKVYGASTCLIAASEGEGFGLPLIEAAQHKLPVIARDIPVFREVAGEHAYYFSGLETDDLAAAIQHWLELYKQGKVPASDSMPWLTWKQSAQQLLQAILPAGEVAANVTIEQLTID